MGRVRGRDLRALVIEALARELVERDYAHHEA